MCKLILHSGLTRLTGILLLLGFPALFLSGTVSAETLHSYAIVNENATLRISGRTVRLYGVHIPETGNSCKFFFNPPSCGSRAAIALDFKIQGFVHCEVLAKHRNRTVTALCRVNRSAFDTGEDLSAYLLESGWALALPDAPFAYHAMERLARHRNLGLWGMPADDIRFPGRKKRPGW